MKNYHLILKTISIFIMVLSLLPDFTPVYGTTGPDVDVDQTVIDLVIDNGTSITEFDIDKVDRFNQYGIAIISDETVMSDNSVQSKYGLMNREGQVLLDPIYEEITDFDTSGKFYLVKRMTAIGTGYFIQQGLFSQVNGSEVLPVKYSWIPSLEGVGVVNLTYFNYTPVYRTDQDGNNIIENGSLVIDFEASIRWKNEVWSHDNGILAKVTGPEGVDLNDYDNIWVEQSHDLFKIIYASRMVSTYEQESKTWITDAKGQVLPDFPRVFETIRYLKNSAGDFLIVYKKDGSINWRSGLYEVTFPEGKVSVKMLLSEDVYNSIWFSDFDSTSEFDIGVNKIVDNIWTQGTYSLLTRDWVVGADPDGYQIYEYPYWDNSDLMMRYHCTKVDNVEKCKTSLYESDDPDKTPILGFDDAGVEKTYDQVFSINKDIIHISNHNESGYPTGGNLVIKNNDDYFKLFSEDVSFSFSASSNNWISDSNGNIFDLTGITNSISYEDLVDSSHLLMSNGWMSNRFSRYIFLYKSADNYSIICSLFDTVTNQFIFRNVRNLNISENEDGKIYGTYTTLDEAQNIHYSGYLYSTNPTDNTPNLIQLPGVKVFGVFNEYGYSKTIEDSSSELMGYVDRDGNQVVPNEYTSFNEHFNRNILIAKTANNTFDYYYFGENPLSLKNLQSVEMNGMDPALLYDGTSYFFVKGNIITAKDSFSLLDNATRVEPFSNGISLIGKNGLVYLVNTEFENKLLDTDFPTLENALDFKYNFVKFSDGSIKFYHDGGVVTLPESITLRYSSEGLTLDHIKRISYNLYTYSLNDSDRSLFYFDPLNDVIVDLGPQSFYPSPDYNYPNYFSYGLATSLLTGILRNDGLVNVQNGNDSYSLKDDLVISTKTDGSQKQTLFDLNGNAVFNEGGNPVYYDMIVLDEKVIELYTFLDGNRDTNTALRSVAIIQKDGTYVFYEGASAKPVENLPGYYTLSRKVGEKTVFGLVKNDGSEIIKLDGENQYASLNIELEQNIVLASRFGKDMITGSDVVLNDGVFDLDGNPYPELEGYSFDSDIDDKGNITVRMDLPYKKSNTQSPSYEDLVRIKNVYNFNTKEFAFSKGYNYYYNSGNYKMYIGVNVSDLENAELIGPGYMGEFFVKWDANTGTWGTDKYRFVTTRGLYSNDNVEIIPIGLFDDIQVVNDYLVVSNFEADSVMGMQSEAGLLDKFGNDVAGVEFVKVDGVQQYDANGYPLVNLKYSFIMYYRAQNKFVLEERRSSGDNRWQQTQSFYDPTTKVLTQDGITYLNFESLKKNGYAIVGYYSNYLDDDPTNDSMDHLNIDEFGNPELRYGVLNSDGSFMLEPDYDYIEDFDRNGYVIFSKFNGPFSCENRNEAPTSLEDSCYDRVQGLLHKTDGVVLNGKYASISPTGGFKNEYERVPVFDENGNIAITLRDSSGLFVYRGLAKKDGEIFEGATYEYAYYLNGYYYLKKFNEDWMIVDASAMGPEDYVGSAWLNFLSANIGTDVIKQVSVPFVPASDEKVSSIERVGEHYIVKIRRFDEDFNKYYYYYGVLNQAMEVFLDFEYSSIIYNDLDQTWNLEIYNTTYGTVQTGIMAMDGTYIVPFNNKYESLSEYVDGYAVGSSGEAPVEEPQQTGSISPMSLLFSAFFLDVKAVEPESEFVLEILDENGQVVSDLSAKYKSVVLLGDSPDGYKALVETSDGFFMATLKSVPFTGIRITAVEIDKTSLTLEKGASAVLYGEIFPLDNNQPKTISWSSSNDQIVSVDMNGNLIAKEYGTTTIYFKVNNFTATCVVTVKDNTGGPTDPETPPVVPTTVESFIEQIEKTNTGVTQSFAEKVQDFLDIINEVDAFDPASFRKLLKDLVNKDENFVDYLNVEEIRKLDDLLIEAYPETLIMNIESNGMAVKLDGLASLIDLKALATGKTVELSLTVSTDLTPEDQSLIEEFAASHFIDPSTSYPLSITLEQTVGNKVTQLTNLEHPIQLTFEIPDDLYNQGTLQVLRVHSGEVSLLDVTLNENRTFSFSSDRFSSFMLVKKPVQDRIDEPVQDTILSPSSSSSSGVLSIAFSAIGLAILGFFANRKFKLIK